MPAPDQTNAQLPTLVLGVVVLVALCPAVLLAMLTDPRLSVAVGAVLAAVVAFVPISHHFRVVRVLCGLWAAAAVAWGVLGLWRW